MSGSLLIASDAGSVTLKPPYYPFQVIWSTQAAPQRLATGKYTTFDPGADYDTWEFEGNFRCTPAEAATLDTLYASGATVQAYPEGFAMFGPRHVTSAITCAIKIFEPGPILENPYRHYAVRLRLEATSLLSNTTPPALKAEGSLIIGGLANLRMPESTQMFSRGVRWSERPGGATSAVKQPIDWTDSVLRMEAYEGNLCAIQEYLEARRYLEMTISTGDLYYIFGPKNGDGTYKAHNIATSMTFSCVDHNLWSFELPIWLKEKVVSP
jgi:hypothetical protein